MSTKKPSYLESTESWQENEQHGEEGLRELQTQLSSHLKVDLLRLPTGASHELITTLGVIFYDMSSSDRKRFIDKIIVVLELAESARSKNPQITYEARDLISDKFHDSFELMMTHVPSLYNTRLTITERLKNLIDCYVDFFEYGYKSLITFPIICMNVINNQTSIQIEVLTLNDPTHKSKILVLENFNNSGLSALILKDGYDNHIRNSGSHGGRTNIPDPNVDSIILSDRDGWSGSFNSRDLEKIIEEIWMTIRAIEFGIEIFTANNKAEWLKYSPETRPTPAEIRDWTISGFDTYGLDIIGVPVIQNTPNNIKVKARFKSGLSVISSPAKKLIVAAFREARIFKWFDSCLIQFYENKKIRFVIKVDNPRDLLQILNKLSNFEEIVKYMENNGYLQEKS